MNSHKYAEKMLFGQAEQKEPKVQVDLEPERRKRVSSLPRITFTYTSRDKYERESPPHLKGSLFPVTTYQKKVSQTQKSSKDELQTTLSSNRTFNKDFNKRRESQEVKRMQAPRHQNKMAVWHIQSSNPGVQKRNGHQELKNEKIEREYYGFERPQIQGSAALNERRNRVITANPDFGQNVEFTSTENQLPNCCWQGKETRSRSLNERILFRNSSQRHI